MNRYQTVLILTVIVACAICLVYPPTMKTPYDDRAGSVVITMTRMTVDYAMLWTRMAFFVLVGIVGCILMRGYNKTYTVTQEEPLI